jgi:hypothetical protein
MHPLCRDCKPMPFPPDVVRPEGVNKSLTMNFNHSARSGTGSERIGDESTTGSRTGFVLHKM